MINGIVAVPVMVIMMLLTHRKDIMGEFVMPPVLQTVGWIAAAAMASTVVTLAITSL